MLIILKTVRHPALLFFCFSPFSYAFRLVFLPPCGEVRSLMLALRSSSFLEGLPAQGEDNVRHQLSFLMLQSIISLVCSVNICIIQIHCNQDVYTVQNMFTGPMHDQTGSILYSTTLLLNRCSIQSYVIGQPHRRHQEKMSFI